MITQFGALSKTLGDNSGNLFATITYLQRFTSMLKANDGQVRLAEQQLAERVRRSWPATGRTWAPRCNELAIALGQVQGFIASNRGLIKSNVTKLASITTILVDERASLSEAREHHPARRGQRGQRLRRRPTTPWTAAAT